MNLEALEHKVLKERYLPIKGLGVTLQFEPVTPNTIAVFL